jgi:hypothetical protein
MWIRNAKNTPNVVRKSSSGETEGFCDICTEDVDPRVASYTISCNRAHQPRGEADDRATSRTTTTEPKVVVRQRLGKLGASVTRSCLHRSWQTRVSWQLRAESLLPSKGLCSYSQRNADRCVGTPAIIDSRTLNARRVRMQQ